MASVHKILYNYEQLSSKNVSNYVLKAAKTEGVLLNKHR